MSSNSKAMKEDTNLVKTRLDFLREEVDILERYIFDESARLGPLKGAFQGADVDAPEVAGETVDVHSDTVQDINILILRVKSLTSIIKDDMKRLEV